MSSVQPYNITIGQESPVYVYIPAREIAQDSGWNDTYTGSPEYVLSGVGNGIPYRTTQYDGARVSLTFEGVAVYMCLTSDEDVEWSVTMTPSASTRQLSGTNDPACSQWGASTLVVADGLAYGTYTVTLTVSSIPSGGHFAFYGSVVSVSIGASGTIAESPQTIDDASSAWTYYPNSEWSQAAESRAINGAVTTTCAYSPQNIATATVTATNVSALYVLGEISPNIAVYTVQMNGDQPLVYNAYNFWLADQVVLFFAGGLDPTEQYTVVLENYDSAYPQSPLPLNCLDIDAIMVVHTQAPPPNSTLGSSTSAGSATAASTSSSSTGAAVPDTSASSAASASTSSSAVGAIVGGAVGGVAVLALLALALVLLLRRRARSARGSPVINSKDIEPPLPTWNNATIPVPYVPSRPSPPILGSEAGLDDRGSVYGIGGAHLGLQMDSPNPRPLWAMREKTPAALRQPYREEIRPVSSRTPSGSGSSPRNVTSPPQTLSVSQQTPYITPTSPQRSEGYLTELPAYESVRGSRPQSRF